MFNKKEIIELNDDIVTLVKRIEKLEGRESGISHNEVDIRIQDLRKEVGIIESTLLNEVDRKLIEFQKEIYGKLFSSVESLFRYAKEIQLVDTLAHNIKDNDIARVKSVLLKPILEERWKTENIEKAQGVSENLVKIIEKRNVLLQDKLKLEREGKESKFISGQLDMLDTIIKESKNEKVS